MVHSSAGRKWSIPVAYGKARGNAHYEEGIPIAYGGAERLFLVLNIILAYHNVRSIKEKYNKWGRRCTAFLAYAGAEILFLVLTKILAYHKVRYITGKQNKNIKSYTSRENKTKNALCGNPTCLYSHMRINACLQQLSSATSPRHCCRYAPKNTVCHRVDIEVSTNWSKSSIFTSNEGFNNGKWQWETIPMMQLSWLIQLS